MQCKSFSAWWDEPYTDGLAHGSAVCSNMVSASRHNRWHRRFGRDVDWPVCARALFDRGRVTTPQAHACVVKDSPAPPVSEAHVPVETDSFRVQMLAGSCCAHPTALLVIVVLAVMVPLCTHRCIVRVSGPVLVCLFACLLACMRACAYAARCLSNRDLARVGTTNGEFK